MGSTENKDVLIEFILHEIFLATNDRHLVRNYQKLRKGSLWFSRYANSDSVGSLQWEAFELEDLFP